MFRHKHKIHAKGNYVKLEKLQNLLNLNINLSKKTNKQTRKQSNWLKVKSLSWNVTADEYE